MRLPYLRCFNELMLRNAQGYIRTASQGEPLGLPLAFISAESSFVQCHRPLAGDYLP
jgi:hypothetical protein